MAGRIRIDGKMARAAGLGGVLLGGVLVLVLLLWAWHDGGERPLRAMQGPTLLPAVVQ